MNAWAGDCRRAGGDAELHALWYDASGVSTLVPEGLRRDRRQL